LGELFSGLWNLIQRRRERFDVLAFEPGDEGVDQLLVDFLGDSFLLPARHDEVLERRRCRVAFDDADQGLDAAASLFRARLKQVKKLVFFAKELLEREHDDASRNTVVTGRTRKISPDAA